MELATTANPALVRQIDTYFHFIAMRNVSQGKEGTERERERESESQNYFIKHNSVLGFFFLIRLPNNEQERNQKEPLVC